MILRLSGAKKIYLRRIETFFEAVELKEIREFERADVAATHCGFAFGRRSTC
jgi:hypothetical protein